MTFGSGIEIKCIDTESDIDLARHRAISGESGYDAGFKFNVWIEHKPMTFEFDLYGLHVLCGFNALDIKSNIYRDTVYAVIETVCDWFSGLTLDDICEKLYYEVEHDLGQKIADVVGEVVIR